LVINAITYSAVQAQGGCKRKKREEKNDIKSCMIIMLAKYWSQRWVQGRYDRCEKIETGEVKQR